MKDILFAYTMLVLERGKPVGLSNQVGLAASVEEARQLIREWNESGSELARRGLKPGGPKWELRGMIPRRVWPKTFEYKLVSAYEIDRIEHVYGRDILLMRFLKDYVEYSAQYEPAGPDRGVGTS